MSINNDPETTQDEVQKALDSVEESRFHMASSLTSLEIKGMFHLQGPQDSTSMEKNVLRLFKSNDKIDQIALNSLNGGLVYSRMNSRLSKKQNEPKPELPAVTFLKLIEDIGFKVLRHYQIENQYCRDNNDNPWLLVFTELGSFIIGWRKSVVSIEWKDMPTVRGIITERNVTKEEYLVHCYGMEEVKENLKALFLLYTATRLKNI